MKRIAFFLLPLLVLTALAPIAPFSTRASAVSGAGFTTVNVSMDGSGHCANGSPAINCNQYDGKEYVWLNGGPSANQLGPDGQYFFAVLAPSGQPAANDGIAQNLSDDFDAYTNRTFTIANGEVNAYAGTHSFDASLIRLFPYADTPNPGGVYTLAICSLANGYPVTARDCKYDAFMVTSAEMATPTYTPTNSDGGDCDHDGGHDPADDVCTATPTSTPTDTPTNTPATATDTATPTTTATATSTPTSTPTTTTTATSTPTTTATATSTPTNTPTPTVTVPACVPGSTKVVKTNFSGLNTGDSVEGADKVAQGLTIDAVASAGTLEPGTQLHVAQFVQANTDPVVYIAGSARVSNGGMDPAGGFSDVYAHTKRLPHHYIFTFASGLQVIDFQVHMQDFGDWNPGIDPVTNANYTAQSARMIALHGAGNIVSSQAFMDSFKGGSLPRTVTSASVSAWVGKDLQIIGDAINSQTVAGGAGKLPGNWLWHVASPNPNDPTKSIQSVQLDFGMNQSAKGYDPNFSLDSLQFTVRCP